MSVCFMIMAHKDPEQFKDLAQTLLDAGGRVVAFIDGKQSLAPYQMKRVEFIEKRHKVNWGGYSQTLAMQKLLRRAVIAFPASSHYVFLSGQDYPIKSVREYIDFLHQEGNSNRCWVNFYAMAPGTQFFDVLKYPTSYDMRAFLGQGIYDRLNKLVSAYYRRRPRTKYPVQFYRGSTSWVLSRQGALAVIEYLDSAQGKRVSRFLKYTHVSDEIWCATALLNSPARDLAVNWETDGQLKPGERFGENKVYHHYIDWSPERENPALLTVDDLPAMDASGKWFARKFDVDKSAELLEVLRKRQS